MKYYISTIADVIYSWNEETQQETITYEHLTGPIAKQYGMGLELTEFCIASNCEHPETVASFFKENLNDYTSDIVLHAPYNELMPHAIEPLLVQAAYKRYDDSYKLCEKYSIPKMIVHANYVPSLYYESWFKERQIEFWKDFLEKHPGNCIICLENVMEDHPGLITDIIKAVDDPRFKMCLDMGHANLHPVRTEQWLEECAPYISHLHIHNNNGPVGGNIPSRGDLHNALGNGQLDYVKLLRRADQLVSDGLTATIESIDFLKSAEWLKEKGFI